MRFAILSIGQFLIAALVSSQFSSTPTQVWTGPPDDCLPVPGDFLPESGPELAVACDGTWTFYSSSGAYISAVYVGFFPGMNQLPVPADFDGDGLLEASFYREGAWFAYNASSGALVMSVWTGGDPGDCQPFVGNFTGDATPELALRCPTSGGGSGSGHALKVWNANAQLLTTYLAKHQSGSDILGAATAFPVNWDGDQYDKIGLYKSGAWFAFSYPAGNTVNEFWTGPPEAIPVPIDTDGDGRDEPAIYCDNGPANCSSGILSGTWHFYDHNLVTDTASYREGVWIADLADQERPVSRVNQQ